MSDNIGIQYNPKDLRGGQHRCSIVAWLSKKKKRKRELSCPETYFSHVRYNSAHVILFICLECVTQDRVTPDSISPRSLPELCYWLYRCRYLTSGLGVFFLISLLVMMNHQWQWLQVELQLEIFD